MPDKKSDAEFSIRDNRSVNIYLECGPVGTIMFQQNIHFMAPPSKSPHARRLVLAKVAKGGINVVIELENHRVRLEVDPAGSNKDLLIRIPIGVRLFKVHADGDLLISYETSDGYNILPHYIKAGTDPDQVMQELVLVVSPVPPRDATACTQPFHPKELSLAELDVRLEQEGLKPI